MKKLIGVLSSMTTMAVTAFMLTGCCCSDNNCCEPCPRPCAPKPCCPRPCAKPCPAPCCPAPSYDNGGCY